MSIQLPEGSINARFLALLVCAFLLIDAYLSWSPVKVVHEVIPRSVGAYDPELGWALKAGALASSQITGPNVTYAINSKGLRGDDVPYERTAGKRRVVILGDSHTFGFGINLDQHFTKLLAGYFPDLEVVNFGVNAWGLDQQMLAYKQEGQKYHPDLVVSYIPHFGGHRHMYARRFGKSKPLFTLRDGTLVQTHVPCDQDGRPNPAAPLPCMTTSLSETEEAQHDAITDDANERDPVYHERMLQLALAIVRETKKAAERSGAAYLLVTRQDDFAERCAQEGIAALNVRPAMDNPAFLLSHGFEHMNEAGNGVLAWELAKYLKEHLSW